MSALPTLVMLLAQSGATSTRGDLSDGLIFDAVRVRLIEIGEAVKLLDPNLVASEPDIKWSDAAGMRDWITHQYFDTFRALVETTLKEDLPPLEAAVLWLQTCLELSKPQSHDNLSRDSKQRW